MSARGVILGAGLAGAIVVVLAGSGCAKVFGIDQLSPLSDGGPGEPCDPYGNNGGQTTPCASGYVCANSVCVKACTADTQCNDGERCGGVNNGGNGGGGVYGCIPAQSEPCPYVGPGGCSNGACSCPGGSECGPDGQCRLSCNTGGMPPCLGGQTCVAFPTSCGGPNATSCQGVCYGSAPHDVSPEGGSPGDGGSSAGDGGGSNVVTLQPSQPGAQGIAVSSNKLFWTTTSQVMQCDLPACTDPQPLAPGEQGPTDLVVVNGTVFWTDQGPGLLRACGVQGCTSAATVATFAPTGMLGPSLGTDGVSVFFASGNQVFSCPAMMASCPTPQHVFPQTNTVFGMAVQGVGSTVYVSRPGAVGSCSGGGCTAEKTVIQNIVNPGVLAVDQNDALLFAADGSGQIVSCPIPGGCSTGNVVISGQPQVMAMLVDGPNLYWASTATSASGSVMRCASGSCMPSAIALASGQNQPWRLAVDSQYLYFTDRADNAVKRVPK